MKLFKIPALVALFAFFGATALSLPAAAASTTDELYEITNNLVDTYNRVFEDMDADDYDFEGAMQAYIDVLSTSETDIEKVLNKNKNKGLKEPVESILASVKELHVSSKGLLTAHINDDEASFDTYFDRYDAAFDAYDAAIDVYNQYLVDNPETDNNLYVVYQWLFYGALILLAGSGLLLFNIKQKPESDAKTAQLQAAKKLLIGAAIATIGSAITYFWYKAAMASEDGTYYIVYGPIIIGYISFFSGLFGYIKALKPTKE
jgi:hypothetical protein